MFPSVQEKASVVSEPTLPIHHLEVLPYACVMYCALHEISKDSPTLTCQAVCKQSLPMLLNNMCFAGSTS